MFLTERFLTERFLTERFLTERFLTKRFHAGRFITKRFLTERFLSERFLTEHFLREHFLHKTFPVTKTLPAIKRSLPQNVFLLQNFSCNKTFPATKRFLPQNVPLQWKPIQHPESYSKTPWELCHPSLNKDENYSIIFLLYPNVNYFSGLRKVYPYYFTFTTFTKVFENFSHFFGLNAHKKPKITNFVSAFEL